MVEPQVAQTFEVELRGCRPEPLASYLKALGVLRLVAEQKDRLARGFWRGDHFVLVSVLDRDALAQFFVSEWRPTPVIAPWNGGSGFYPKDNQAAADAILTSKNPRLDRFAESIKIARAFVAAQGWTERPADESKQYTLSVMRARLPDEALAWVDAAVVVGDDRLLFPPLLGTGGNDGRLDFSNNFQQRVVEVLEARSTGDIGSALFGTFATSAFKGTMGQYKPAASARTNPWDFVLLIEGALVFASSATRRYESSGPARLAFPFHARAAGGASTVTDSDENDSRDELWLPLWSRPATAREIRRLFAEGRATVGHGDVAHPASSALDFARAIAALGVDRGIDSFVRIGFHVRNGLAYYATPLGRFATNEIPSARLLDDIDGWYGRFRLKASGKNVPMRVAVAHRRLEQVLFDATGANTLAPVLLQLADAERALGQSLSFAANAFLSPVPRLKSEWARRVHDGSVEQRLASALAAKPNMRARLVPLERGGRAFGSEDDLHCIFKSRPLVDNLNALLLREDTEQQQGRAPVPSGSAIAYCCLTDVARFVNEQVDDELIERWLRALVLLEEPPLFPVPTPTLLPSASFAVLAIVHSQQVRGEAIPRTPTVLTRACAGDAEAATRPAIRRLIATGCPLPVDSLFEPAGRMRRIAAALAFPLSNQQRRALERMVLSANSSNVQPTEEQA